MNSGYVMLFISKLKMIAIYHEDFILGLIISLIKAFIGIFFLHIIFINASDLGGVNSDLARCLFFSVALAQTVMNLFFPGLIDFSGIYIRGGDLEPVLLKPVNKILYIIVDNIDIREFPSLMVNLVLYGLSIIMLSQSPMDFWILLTLILAPLISIGTMVSMTLLIDCISFRFRDTLMAVKFIISLSDMCRYPLSIYRKDLQYLFSLIVPLGCIQLISWSDSEKIPLYLGIAAMSVLVLLFLSSKLFLYSFRWYESTGS